MQFEKRRSKVAQGEKEKGIYAYQELRLPPVLHVRDTYPALSYPILSGPTRTEMSDRWRAHDLGGVDDAKGKEEAVCCAGQGCTVRIYMGGNEADQGGSDCVGSVVGIQCAACQHLHVKRRGAAVAELDCLFSGLEIIKSYDAATGREEE
jgi:hypothetical protein